jgi:hypothetical protein
MVTLLGRMSSHHGGAFPSTQSVNSLDDHFWRNETIPEGVIGWLTQGQDEITTSVDARVSGSGCAKMRKTGAQGAPEAPRMGAEMAFGPSLLGERIRW